jgi:hypothetical protein
VDLADFANKLFISRTFHLELFFIKENVIKGQRQFLVPIGSNMQKCYDFAEKKGSNY